jgi:hypothetical protein
VILAGRNPDDFRWECEDRPQLYEDRLVLDMTCLDDLHGNQERTSSLIEQIEARVPSARAVAIATPRPLWRLPAAGHEEIAYVCGRDEGAKAQAATLLRALGFDTEDVGGARAARMLHLISGIHGRTRTFVPQEIRRRDDAFAAPDVRTITAAEASDLARVELRAERIAEATGASGREDWIRWHVGALQIDLLGVPDRDGYVLARRLLEWERALLESSASVFLTEVVGRSGRVSLGHQRTTHDATVVLLVDGGRRQCEQFEAVLTRDRLLGLIGDSRRLVAEATAEAARAPSLPSTLFARAEGGRLVVDGEHPLADGTVVLLAPTTHIDEVGRLTRIHAPERFDAEVFHVPTAEEQHELGMPHAPHPDITVEGSFVLPANGWASFTVRVGHHEVTLLESDCGDPPVTQALHGLVRALEADALPFRDRGDEEGEEVSLGVRRTSSPELVLLSVSNLASASLEALVPRAELLAELKKALAVVDEGAWAR